MDRRPFQRSELLTGYGAVLAALLLCVVFVLFLYSGFLSAVAHYNSISREHATALFQRADAQVLFVETATRVIQADVLTRSATLRRDKLLELPLKTDRGIEAINEGGKGVVLWAEKIAAREHLDEFVRHAEVLSSLVGVADNELLHDSHRSLISAEQLLLFSALGTMEDWKEEPARGPNALANYIEAIRAPIIHELTDPAQRPGMGDGSGWTTAHPRVTDGVQVITCYAPLYDEQGMIASFLASEVAVSALAGDQALQQYDMSLVVFDAKGRLIVGDAALAQANAQSADYRTAKGGSGLTYTIDGARLLIAVQAPDDHWRVVYGVPLSRVFYTHWLMVALASCVLLSGLMGIVLLLRNARNRLRISGQLSVAQLREGRALLQELMNLSPVGLCLIRRSDGHVLIQNPRSQELIALEVEHEGQWYRLCDYFLRSFGRFASGDVFELDAREPDSGRRMHILAKQVDVTYHGEPALYCSFGDDSERKEAERMLASAKTAAEEANAAKSTFLAMMSHEIRTPLYGVLGTLELLGSTALLAQQRSYLNTIGHSSSNLLHIIDDILDFSRIEANQMALESVSFNLIELVEGVARNFAPLAQKKLLEFFCCVQPGLPLLVGDPNRLQQVLSNLLSNALKFTDSGKVVIRIGGAEKAEGRFELRIQVSDSGIGIDKASQAKLFEPFVQADNTTARRFGGTGLGLSICRRLVALMGGVIELVSEPGLGSSFSFSLELAVAGTLPSLSLEGMPTIKVLVGANEQRDALLSLIEHAGGRAQSTTGIRPGPTSGDLLLVAWSHRPGMTFGNQYAGVVWLDPQGAPTPVWREDGWYVSSLSQQGVLHALQLADGDEPDSQAAIPAIAPAQFKSMRVLVAEDHPINQLVLTEQLQQLGFEVTMTSNGLEALQRWQAGECFDVVVTDVNMPELDGYQLTCQLRAEGVDVPIIGVTASAQAEEGERCLQSGMSGYLAKPVSLARLREALQAVGIRVAGPPRSNVMTRLGDIEPAMRDLFVLTTRQDWVAMMSLLSEGNAGAVARYAHRIKGALVAIGSMEAAEFCSRLEEMATAGDLSRIDECLGNLQDYLNPILETST